MPTLGCAALLVPATLTDTFRQKSAAISVRTADDQMDLGSGAAPAPGVRYQLWRFSVLGGVASDVSIESVRSSFFARTPMDIRCHCPPTRTAFSPPSPPHP